MPQVGAASRCTEFIRLYLLKTEGAHWKLSRTPRRSHVCQKPECRRPNVYKPGGYECFGGHAQSDKHRHTPAFPVRLNFPGGGSCVAAILDDSVSLGGMPHVSTASVQELRNAIRTFKPVECKVSVHTPHRLVIVTSISSSGEGSATGPSFAAAGASSASVPAAAAAAPIPGPGAGPPGLPTAATPSSFAAAGASSASVPAAAAAALTPGPGAGPPGLPTAATPSSFAAARASSASVPAAAAAALTPGPGAIFTRSCTRNGPTTPEAERKRWARANEAPEKRAERLKKDAKRKRQKRAAQFKKAVK